MIKLGCHVGMSGKEMFLGSVKEALSYNANTFMIYTLSLIHISEPTRP